MQVYSAHADCVWLVCRCLLIMPCARRNPKRARAIRCLRHHFGPTQAEEHYSDALRLDAGLAPAHNNRALVRLRLGRWADAEADCTAVLAREALNVKALLRRAAAQ